MSLLLGSASAKVSLDIGSFMANASTAESKMNQLANAGGTGAGGGFLDKMTKGALGLGTALIVPMGMGLKAAVDLEQGIANINASLGGLDASTLDQLADSFNEIGAASQFSATEVAAVADSLAKAGFTTEQLLGGATQAVVDLSQATGDGLQPAMDGVIIAMNTWSESTAGTEDAMTDAARVADILTTAANSSSAGIGDINAGMRSLGPVAASMGIGFDESAAAIALFTNNGLKGADAGVSLARGLQNLANPTSEAATLMADLSIAAFDSQGSFVGFPSLFDQLKTSMGGMDDQTQLLALSTIFGAEAMDVMGLAILNGAEPLEALIDLMGESGTAAEQSALRMDTLGAQFDTLKEGVTTFLGSLVTGLIPGMRWVVDGANVLLDVLMRIPAPIKTIIGAIAGGLAAFAAITQAVRAFSLVSGLLGSTGFLGLGVSLGTLIPIALGVAAVASLIYYAWKTNFLGLRDVVKGAFKPISKFIADFKKSWNGLKGTSDVMDQILGWGGQANKIVGPINSVSRALSAMAMAIRGIGGDNTPAWLVGLADGFDRAAEFVSGFKREWDNLGISSITDQINQWGGITSTSMGIGERALRSFSAGLKAINGDDTPAWLVQLAFGFDRLADSLAVGGVGGLISQIGTEIRSLVSGIDIGAVAVNIGSWARGTIADIWPYVTAWASDAMGAVAGAAGTIWGVIVNVGSWAKGIITDIWPYVTQWASEAMNGIASAAGTIWNVIVNIGSWAKGIVSDIWPYITGWVSEAMGAVASAAGTIWNVLVNIGSWAKGIVSDIGPYIASWVSDATSAVATAAGTVWNVLVNIGSWAKGIVSDIGPYIVQWAKSAISAVTSAAATVWNVIVNVGSWAKGIVSDIGPYIRSWAEAAVNGVTSAAATIWNVLVNVGSWAKGIVSDIAPYVQGWATSAIDGITGAVGTISGAIVDLTSWAKGAWADLSAWVKSEVALAWTGNTDDPVNLGIVSVKVGTFDVDVDFGSLNTAINNKFIEETTLTDADLSGINAAGQSHGQKVMTAFTGAIGAGIALFSGGGGDGTGGAGNASGNVAFSRAVTNYVSGLFTGAGDVFSETVAPQLQTLSDNLGAGLQSWADGITGLFDDLSFPDVSLSLPTITWPDLPGINDIPFVTDFIELLGAITSLIKGIKWSFDVGVPTIDWPNPLDLVPPDIKDFLSNPWKYAQSQFGGGGEEVSIGKPEGGGGGKMGPLESRRSDNQIASINTSGAIAQLDAFENKIVRVSDRLAALRAPGGAGAGITVDTAGAISSLKDLDLTIDGTQLKLAALGGGGGGMGRAATGGGGQAATNPLSSMTTAIQTEVTKWPGIINTAAALMGAAGLNAGAVAGYGVVNGIGMAQPLIDAAFLAWSTAINTQAATMGAAALNAGAVAGFGVVNGLAMAQVMIDAAYLLWSAGINLAAAAMGAAALNAGAVAGYGVVNGITSAQGSVDGAIAAWTAAINAQAGPMGSAGLNAGSVAGYGVANGIASAEGTISGNVAVWPGIINGIAGSMGSAGLNAGAAAGYGVANGLASALGSVQAAANDIAAVVASTMALRLLISSPSRVTTRLGEYVGQGLALGMLNEKDTVARASSTLGLAAIPTLPAIPAYAPNVGTSRGGGTVIHYHSEVNMPVAGSVVTEDGLILKAVRAVGTGLQQGEQELKRSLGVS